MADANHEDSQDVVLDVSNDAVVANPVIPEFFELRPSERFSDCSGIIESSHTSVKKFQNTASCIVAKLLKFSLRITLQLNLPSHTSS